MKDINVIESEPSASPREAVPLSSAPLTPPDPTRTRRRVYKVLLIALVVFGYGPAVTYGLLTWLLNEAQWFWAILCYLFEVPLVGGFFTLVLPLRWYRPIDRALRAWAQGEPPTQAQCLSVYQTALKLPWRVAMSAVIAATVGYLLGLAIVHWQAEQPVIEILKTLPAIPLVGGLMGAFGYFGLARTLYPVLRWSSRQLERHPHVPPVSLAAKFLTVTCVLMVATLCLLEPTAYTRGQVIVEEHLKDRTVQQLRTLAHALSPAIPLDFRILQRAALGSHGYVVAINTEGDILTRHPAGLSHLNQERFYRVRDRMASDFGAWVDRVRHHRVVAFVRLMNPPGTLVSVAYLKDFDEPLRHFVALSWIVILEVLVVVLVLGRYYTKGIITSLAELTAVTQRIAKQGDLSQRLPVTTNDEISEVARSFNRMVEELQASKASLEDYTRRLEQSTRELAALNQEMEDLLRVVSHDLRSPLINIQGFSKRLEPLMHETISTLEEIARHSRENGLRKQVDFLRTSVQARLSESLQFISKGVEKMDTLLSLLLAISRVGRKADPIRSNDLGAILDDVLPTFDHQLKERAIEVIRHPLPTAPCRRNEINQVFSNLLSNAINYMGPSERRFIEIGGVERGDHIECFVRDTGIGIASEDHERIFQMFTRLEAVHVPGEGVGLAYVKKILRSHGGKIWVASKPGEGSTFTFTLPKG